MTNFVWAAPPALAAAFFLSTCSAEAQTITVVVQFMPQAAVVERCSDPAIADELERRLRAQRGCFGGWLPAVDDPNNLWCKLFVPLLPDRPWDQAALVELLRPECEGAGR